VFDGAVNEYLVHALESRKLSAGELDELEAMIADAKKQAKGKTPNKGKTKGEQR
jgi:hypothetical protein